MSAPPARSPGTPCWFEIGGPPQAEVTEFWADVLGWTYDYNEVVSGYLRSYADGAKIAGLGGPVQPCPRRGWRVYVHTDDLANSLAAAVALGADTIAPPAQAGPDGWFAWMRDPQGCLTGLFEPSGDPGTARQPGPGRVAGWTLLSPDPKDSLAFYSALFPDFASHVDVEPGGDGWVVTVRGRGATVGDVADPRGNRLRVIQ